MLLKMDRMVRSCFQAEEDGMRCPKDDGLLRRSFGSKDGISRCLHKLKVTSLGGREQQTTNP